MDGLKSERLVSQSVDLAADLCRFFEGFSSKPYICPAGYPTIGYGTVYKPDGTKVTMQDAPISKELANDWLMRELEHNYMAGVLKASPILIANERLLAAITDFAYNLGVGRYRASTLKRRVDSNDLLGVETELRKWTKGGGKVLPGLVKRRQAEIDLIRS
jgi:lysozyme